MGRLWRQTDVFEFPVGGGAPSAPDGSSLSSLSFCDKAGISHQLEFDPGISKSAEKVLFSHFWGVQKFLRPLDFADLGVETKKKF